MKQAGVSAMTKAWMNLEMKLVTEVAKLQLASHVWIVHHCDWYCSNFLFHENSGYRYASPTIYKARHTFGIITLDTGVMYETSEQCTLSMQFEVWECLKERVPCSGREKLEVDEKLHPALYRGVALQSLRFQDYLHRTFQLIVHRTSENSQLLSKASSVH